MNDLRKMKLVKSRTNKMLTGVCGGIGELLGIDPTIIRLIWAALSLAGGTGIILYIIAAVIIPEDDDIIDINITERKLDVRVSEQELEERKKRWKAPEKELTGYIKRYAQHVTSGSRGAVFEK